MWDKFRLSAVGNFYLRKIALLIVAGLMSALFVAILNSHPTYADDASWSGDQITYDGNPYSKMSNPPALPNLDPSYGNIYSRNDGGKAYVIAVKDDTDKTKPITDAQYRVYNVAGGVYSSSTDPPKTITVGAQGNPDGGNGDGGQKNQTSCAVPSIGWIICGTSKFIAAGMDKIFEIIAGFLKVKPISTDTNSGLYIAWNTARGFANLCFIVAFLIVIYSQITSIGISNYEIKKMVPKLIIAAILVNVSYYVCAYAVDISNILGDSVQKALIDIRHSLPNPMPDGGGIDYFSWQNVTQYVLSGGTIAAGVFAAKAAFLGGTAGGSVSALTFLLFPILVSGAISVLIAVMVLAARQAIITALIVVSPLAFVAYLLPNTEKWFERWRELLTTMLLIFPAFSLLFGGSQLASYIIIQNADQISVVIFAMFVQVAPLVLTPFLARLSGTLGKLMGMVNNPKRGLVDRSRNWAQDRAEVQRAKGMEAAANRAGTRWQRKAYKRELDKQNREAWKKRGQAHIDAGWHQDSRYRTHHESLGTAELIQKHGEAEANLHFEREKARNPNLQQYIGNTRLADDTTKMLQSQEEQAYLEAKTSKVSENNRFVGLAHQIQQVQRSQDLSDSALNAAKEVQREEYGKALIASESMQAMAGGVAGMERGLNTGIAEYRKAYNENVARAQQTLKHYNLSGPQRQALALGEEVVAFDANGEMKILRHDSHFAREAAIEAQLTTGTYAEIEKIVEASGTTLSQFRTTIQDMVGTNKLSSKAVFLGGQTINDIGQNLIKGAEGLDAAVLRTIVQGKVSEGDLATNDAVALQRMLDVAQRSLESPPPGTNVAVLEQKVIGLKQAAWNALNNKSISGSIKENSREVLEDMLTKLQGDINRGERPEGSTTDATSTTSPTGDPESAGSPAVDRGADPRGSDDDIGGTTT